MEGARADVLGGWGLVRLGMGREVVLKPELLIVPSTGGFILLCPNLFDSPLKPVKSLKSNNSPDQSALEGASKG